VRLLQALTIAAVLLGIGAVPARPTESSLALGNGQKEPPAHIRKFAGTVMRNGDQFVLNDAKTHTLYQLDDQTAASRFEDKEVTVIGTLDTVKNLIRIQSIADATA
jgi:hypothetical protein